MDKGSCVSGRGRRVSMGGISSGAVGLMLPGVSPGARSLLLERQPPVFKAQDPGTVSPCQYLCEEPNKPFLIVIILM